MKSCQIIFPRQILGSFSANYGPANVMTFFSYFGLHLLSDGKMNICGRDDLFFYFFWPSLLLGGKMDICGRDDLFFYFFGLHLLLGEKMDICGRDDLP